MEKKNLFELARAIPVQEAARRAGLAMRMRNGRGWAQCPMHGEKTASLCLYEGGRGFYCFGCHEGGDAIRLYERLFGLTPKEAAQRLAQDFGLEGDFTPPARASPREKPKPVGTLKIGAVCGVMHRAQKDLQRFTPETMDDPAFTRALAALSAAQMQLNLNDMKNAITHYSERSNL